MQSQVDSWRPPRGCSRPAGQTRRGALLRELANVPGVHRSPVYVTLVPEFVRCALVLGEPELVARLVEVVEPHTPLAEHALTACRAQLAKPPATTPRPPLSTPRRPSAGGSSRTSPSAAYVLLGEGRCLLALGELDADNPLREARELFASMGYKPALAETEALLAQDEAAV